MIGFPQSLVVFHAFVPYLQILISESTLKKSYIKKILQEHTMKIPGLSFSLKRAVGISALKQKVSKATGIPLTKQGLERKIGGSITKAVTGKKKK